MEKYINILQAEEHIEHIFKLKLTPWIYKFNKMPFYFHFDELHNKTIINVKIQQINIEVINYSVTFYSHSIWSK